MKKNSLFKVLGIVLLAYCVLTWIFPAVTSFGGDIATATRNQISIFNIFSVTFESFSAFANVILFIILVGAFYAILEETGVYNKALDFFKNKFGKNSKWFLIAVIVIIAIISSVAGLEIGMFFLFPFIISILLVMGYDKFVALSATLGATIVGMFGSTLSGTMYNIADQIFGISIYDGIIVKIVLFVLGLALLLFFTLMHISKGNSKEVKSGKKDDKKKSKKDEVKKVEDKKENIVVAPKKVSNKPIWPMLLIMVLVLVVFILGSIDFSSLGTDAFVKANDVVMGLEVSGFAIFGKLIGGLGAFGTWLDPSRFMYYSIILILAMLIISIIYRIKFDDQISCFVKGVKDYFVIGILVALAYTMFVLVYYYKAFDTIGTWFMGLTDNFNVATSGIFSFVSSIFYVDIYYYSYFVLQYVGQFVTDASLYPLVSTMFVSLYGLAMLVAPTSVLLIASLSITDVSYGSWLKYIWKLFLSLFVLAFIVFLIVFLI